MKEGRIAVETGGSKKARNGESKGRKRAPGKNLCYVSGREKP